eukprot:COSAG05_NODE_9077_length_649_cov_1.283636_1_plen_24_part_10
MYIHVMVKLHVTLLAPTFATVRIR